MSFVQKKYPVYKLSPDRMTNPRKSYTFGGYHADSPPRIELTPEKPYIYNTDKHSERYEMYVNNGLIPVPPPQVPVEAVEEEIKDIVSSLDDDGVVPEADPKEIEERKKASQEETAKLAKVAIDIIESDDVEIKTAAEAIQLPSVEELKSMNRKQLVEVAEDINVWDDVESSRDDNYKSKDDVLSHLLSLHKGS